MQSSKVRARLKAQLTKFALALTEGLSQPLRNFRAEMLFGIQASEDVKLSNIARSLKEAIPLIKTEDRLSRNLKAVELESRLSERLAELGSGRLETNDVLCLDLSDVRKEYAEKRQYLDQVWDGARVEYTRLLVVERDGGGSGGERDHAAVPEIILRAGEGFCERERGGTGGRRSDSSAHARAWDLDDRPRWGSEEAVGAAAGAGRTLRDSIDRGAFGDRSEGPQGRRSPFWGEVSPPLSSAGRQD